jgi:hypothetical protein
MKLGVLQLQYADVEPFYAGTKGWGLKANVDIKA